MGLIMKGSVAAVVIVWLAAPPGSEKVQTRTFSNSLLMVGGKCVELAAPTSESQIHIETFDCKGGPSQRWTLRADGLIHSSLNFNKCLGLPGLDSDNKTAIELRDCSGGAHQNWSYRDDSTIRGLDGKCLDLPHGDLRNHTRIELYDCHGSWNQQFMAAP